MRTKVNKMKTSVALAPQTLAALKRAAALQDRSVSNIIKRIIKRELPPLELEHKRPQINPAGRAGKSEPPSVIQTGHSAIKRRGKLAPKDLMIKSRVSVGMKQRVANYALAINENESFVLREALREFFDRRSI